MTSETADPETQRWAARASQVMPGRQSNFRGAGTAPLYLQRGQGQWYWDVDGRDFIDFTLGAGPGILGHAHPRIVAALQEQAARLYYIAAGAAQSTLEVELAELIHTHVPCAEWTRFALSGTEAVQLAIRLARGFTARPYFVRFEGHYHGTADNVFGGVLNPDANALPFAIDTADDPVRSAGRAPNARRECFLLPWNDGDLLEKFLARHGHEVGLVLMEAVLCNAGCCPPRPGYLQRVRELCNQHGCLLCFDEVITGFRMGLGGAQAALGVTPDLATFGKAIGGGMPVSAVAGRADILDQLRSNRVLAGGTFNAAPMGLAAAIATLTELAADNGAAYRLIAAQQAKLAAALRTEFERAGHKVLIQGPNGVLFVEFIDLDVAWTPKQLAAADPGKMPRLRALALQEGLLLAGGNRFFVSTALADSDIEEVQRRLARALARLDS